MEMEPQDEAKWLEQMRSQIRPMQNGDAPFYDDPSDVAAHLGNNLHNIEAGQAVITEVTLPYIEGEAIARIRARTPFGPIVEPDKRKEPEYWRQKWVVEALRVEHQLFGVDQVGQSAIRVLITASRLRSAIAEANPQMIAALSMLLGCELFEGGYMLASEANHRAARKAKSDKTMAYESGAGRSHQDLVKARKGAVEYAKKSWAGNSEIRIGEMAKDILQRLRENKDKLPTLESFPKPDTIKAWLREAGADGSLEIPEAAQKRGRRKGN